MEASRKLLCPNCGRDLTGISAVACTGCGVELKETEPDVTHDVAATRKSSMRRRLIMGIGWLAIVIVYSVGAGVMLRSIDEIWFGVLALSFVVIGSLVCGRLAVIGRAPAERIIALDVWRRQLWLLHLPWLVMAPAALTLAAMWYYIGGIPEKGMFSTVSFICLVAWIVCSSRVWHAWENRTGRELARHIVEPAKIRGRLKTAASWVYFGTVLLGLLGGLLTIGGSVDFVTFLLNRR